MDIFCFYLAFFYSQLQELAQASGLTVDLVQGWFSSKASLSGTEQPAAARVTGPRPVAPAEPRTTGSSPLESQPGGGTEVKMEQSVCGVATQEEEEVANTEKTVNPTEGSLHVQSNLQSQTKIGQAGCNTSWPDCLLLTIVYLIHVNKAKGEAFSLHVLSD